jgi:hypothetical protein
MEVSGFPSWSVMLRRFWFALLSVFSIRPFIFLPERFAALTRPSTSFLVTFLFFGITPSSCG